MAIRPASIAVITTLVTMIGFKIGNNILIVIFQKLQPSIMDASSISRGTPFTKLQNVITVKGIRNEIKIQITEKKVPYICKYYNKKKIDAICKANVRPKIK